MTLDLSMMTYVVHGFVEAVYNVMEEDILNTRFELNVKGMTHFSGLLNIQGTITSLAGGSASEYTCNIQCTTLSFLTIQSEDSLLCRDTLIA